MPRSSTTGTPRWKSHPIYNLRFSLLLSAIIGVILFLLALCSTSRYVAGPFAFGILLLLASAAFCLWDLITWSRSSSTSTAASRPPLPVHASRVRDDDDDDDDAPAPSWPRLALLIWDAIFALLLQWLFWICLSCIGPYGYSTPPVVVTQAYAALACQVSSVLHGRAFWKELMARKKLKWESERRAQATTCPSCGFTDNDDEDEESETTPAEVVRNLNRSVKEKLARMIKGAKSGKLDVEAGNRSEATEESLLITPDEPSSSSHPGYGGFEDEGRAIAAPEEQVVKKKGKSRIIGGGDGLKTVGTPGGKETQISPVDA